MRESLDQQLRLACYEGEDEQVKSLLAQGADPNGIEESTGFFPLERAAVCERSSVLGLLVSAGADIDQCDSRSGLTPLMLSSWDASIDTVKELVRLGANTQIQAFDGSVALHYACREGFRDVAEVILGAGGWSIRRNKQGETPLDIAIATSCRPGLVTSLAVRASAKELAEILSVWEPWRLHQQAFKKERSLADDDCVIFPAPWVNSSEMAMMRLSEVHVVMEHWTERALLEAAVPEAAVPEVAPLLLLTRL